MNDITKAPRAGLGAFVGKQMQKVVKFMDSEVTIMKMTVAQVQAIQESAQAQQRRIDDVAKAKESGESFEDVEGSDFDVLRLIIRSGVLGATDMTDEELEDLPIDELSTLSQAVMAYVGLGEQKKGK